MKAAIAYFDFLGYGEFVKNNSLEEQYEIVKNNLRDIEIALSKGKTKQGKLFRIPDLSNTGINCLNFSDTIIFWTYDDSLDALLEFLELAHTYNYNAINYFFPVRGVLVYGEFGSITLNTRNNSKVIYQGVSIFGNSLIMANQKANDQNWAGTVLNECFINHLKEKCNNFDEAIGAFAKKYNVPYKNSINLPDEYVLKIAPDNINLSHIKNLEDGIISNFKQYKKPIDNNYIKEKINNTLAFLRTFSNEGAQ